MTFQSETVGVLLQSFKLDGASWLNADAHACNLKVLGLKLGRTLATYTMVFCGLFR
jgi:hypothetical protein